MYQFAIIGCGRVAAQHAEQITRVGTLKAVCDIDVAKANALAAKYGATAYNNINDLLKLEKEIKIVVVCTPNGLHAEHAIKSIQGGRHVLCEEPMCITSVAASQINDTAHFFRRRFFIVSRSRYNGAATLAKEVIKSGKIGTLHSFKLCGYWSNLKNKEAEKTAMQKIDGGPLYTAFHHYINLLHTTLGMGNLKSLYDPQTNAFAAVAQTEEKVVGTLHFINVDTLNNYKPSFKLFGSKGTIELTGSLLDQFEWINEKDMLDAVQVKEHREPLAHTYADMLASINNPQLKDVTVMNAMKTVGLLEQMTQNAYAE